MPSTEANQKYATHPGSDESEPPSPIGMNLRRDDQNREVWACPSM
jgi:hypothetical protein